MPRGNSTPLFMPSCALCRVSVSWISRHPGSGFLSVCPFRVSIILINRAHPQLFDEPFSKVAFFTSFSVPHVHRTLLAGCPLISASESITVSWPNITPTGIRIFGFLGMFLPMKNPALWRGMVESGAGQKGTSSHSQSSQPVVLNSSGTIDLCC